MFPQQSHPVYEGNSVCFVKVSVLEPTSNNTPQNGPALDSLRRELDELDNAMLGLLAQRFEVTAKVRTLKMVQDKSLMSPLRPAREAVIQRRLVALAKAHGLSPHLVMRLWRQILSQSSLEQAPVVIHASRKLCQNIAHRLRLRDHFGAFAVEEWRDEAQALMQVNASPGDLCLVETESGWIEPYLAQQGGPAQIIGTLPAIKDQPEPKLLVIGNAPSEPTGEDETLLITKGNLPRDFAVQPLWQVKVGSYRLSALAGFFSDRESPLVGLMRSNISLGLKVAGRYPSAFEV